MIPPSTHRYFIRLSYFGKHFVGWQIQPQGRTVQGELEHALSLVLRHPVVVTGAGRTDTGVHAREMWAHFDTYTTLSDEACIQLCERLNRILYRDIVVHRLIPVPLSAHARFDAISRTYRYYITSERDPFTHEQETHIHQPLDFEAMSIASHCLVGTHDFETFSKKHTDVRTTICTVYTAEWKRISEHKHYYEISANRFLRNMVRSIVGQLLMVGRGKLTAERFQEILYLRDRQLATITAPAQGLYLEEIKYPYPL